MKIVIDAMGGRHAPMEIIRGAMDAAADQDLYLILTGRGEEILRCLAQLGYATLPGNVEVGNAPDVVTVDDDPASVLREKEHSSMAAALRMLAEGTADAMVSAGSAGALLTGAEQIVKRLAGVQRAAFASMLPGAQGGVLLLDSGSNAECTPEMLAQFAAMGAGYMKRRKLILEPRVGLLNIGSEESAGGVLHREAYALLAAEAEAGRLNFVGNVEADMALTGACDVLAADGFGGSVLLKGLEAMGGLMTARLRELLKAKGRTRIAAKLAAKELGVLKAQYSPEEIGSSVLLGVRKPVVKAHGASDARTVKNAIVHAAQLVKSAVPAGITRELALEGEEIQR